jgi:AraC-like DNA-binding protein
MDDFSTMPIHFERPCNAIKIPKAVLSLPLNPAADPYNLALQPDYEAFRLSAPVQDFVGSLEQLIRAALPQGYADTTSMAAATGMSVRSLQRQLAEAGLSYSQLIDRVRLDLAMNLLKQPRVKLIDVATELGYTDSANFTRAFKRWAGVSPREFRQQHQNSRG